MKQIKSIQHRGRSSHVVPLRQNYTLQHKSRLSPIAPQRQIVFLPWGAGLLKLCHCAKRILRTTVHPNLCRCNSALPLPWCFATAAVFLHKSVFCLLWALSMLALHPVQPAVCPCRIAFRKAPITSVSSGCGAI